MELHPPYTRSVWVLQDDGIKGAPMAVLWFPAEHLKMENGMSTIHACFHAFIRAEVHMHGKGAVGNGAFTRVDIYM